MKIETIALKDLKLDPNNARTHSETNLEAISGSLTQFGQRKPIVVTDDNIIVAGNGTFTAAQSLGWKEIDVVRIPADWSEDQIKAFALADNRSSELASWNPEVLQSQLLELVEFGTDVKALGFEIPEMPGEEEWADLFETTNKERSEITQISFLLHVDQAETLNSALEQAKALGDFGDTGNTNGNGNAIARICELWLGTQVGS